MQDYGQDKLKARQPGDSESVSSVGKNSQYNYYIKNKIRRLELIQQKLTAKTYREKFHELLEYEEEEHEKILKERFALVINLLVSAYKFRC